MNRSLLKIIKTRLEGAKGAWPEELPNVLWAYKTTTKVLTGEVVDDQVFLEYLSIRKLSL